MANKKIRMRQRKNAIYDILWPETTIDQILLANGSLMQDKMPLAPNSNILVVAQIGGRFTTINDAITYAKTYCSLTNRVTILVSPGDYNEEIILMPNPGIDIVGLGKVRIIYASWYPNSPLYTVGTGHFENLEFILPAGVSQPSYAFHFENANNAATGTVVCVNCTFDSYTAMGIGAGLGQDCGILLINCRVYTHASSTPNPMPALYFHNRMVDNVSNQVFKAVNCEFTSFTSPYGVKIDNIAKQTGHLNSVMNVSFQNCYSKTPRMIYYDGTVTLNALPPSDTNIIIDESSVNCQIYGVDKNKYYDVVSAIAYVRNDGFFTVFYPDAERFNYTVDSAYNESGHTITNTVTVESKQANSVTLKTTNSLTFNKSINIGLIAIPL